MIVLRIEHPVTDFAAWRAAFDRDPIGRARGGVRAYRIQRPLGDDRRVLIDLEFEDRDRAESFREALLALWRTPEAMRAYAGTPAVQVIETIEQATY
jgi:hypothetical protein